MIEIMRGSNRKKKTHIKTRLGEFVCVFESNSPGKGYTVTVPGVKGVVTFGDNLAEAKRNVKEALELHCGCLLEEGMAKVAILPTAKTRGTVRV